MNHFIKLFYLLTLSLLFFACSSSSQVEQTQVEQKKLTLEELLIKNWKLHQVAGTNSKDGTDSHIFYEDKYIEFRKDQTYTTNATKYFKKEEGIWNINETRDSIYFNKDTEKQIVLSISHIYEKGLSLLSYETESEEEIYGQLYALEFR